MALYAKSDGKVYVRKPSTGETAVITEGDARLTDARTPTAHTHAAADITSGVLATARLGTGTANTSTFLRGDGSWQTVPAGVTSLSALTDVTVTSPVTGDVIRWDGSIWRNAALSITDLPVALSGVSSATELVRADDARLIRRATKQGYVASGSEYYELARLPIDNSGNFSSLIITGRAGGWINANQAYWEILLTNRGDYTGDNVGAAVTGLGAYAAAKGLTDVVVYKQADKSAIVYLEASGYYTYDISYQTFQATPTYSGTAVTPAGTQIWSMAAAPMFTVDQSGVAAAGGQALVKNNDARLSDARTPTAHTHTKSQITDLGTIGTAAAKNVPAAGNAATGEVVLGSDTRLSDARTPTAHTHTKSNITDFAHTHPNTDITGLGTASTKNAPASGNAASTEVVLGSDSRLSDSRTPTAHTHVATTDLTATGTKSTSTYLRGDNTWATPPNTTYAVPSQAEAEAGTATTGRAFSAQRVNQAIQALAPVKPADLETRGLRYLFSPGVTGGTRRWGRLFTIDGLSTYTGGYVNAILSGTGDYGNANRGTILIHAAQRNNDGFSVKAWAWNVDSTSDPIELYSKQISTYVFEVWAKFSDYNQNHELHVLAQSNATINLDSFSTTEPTPVVAYPVVDYDTALNGKASTSHTHSVTDLTATGVRDATTFLRGDNTWATVQAGGGDPIAPIDTTEPAGAVEGLLWYDSDDDEFLVDVSYVQPDEPTGAAEGALWLDTDDPEAHTDSDHTGLASVDHTHDLSAYATGVDLTAGLATQGRRRTYARLHRGRRRSRHRAGALRLHDSDDSGRAEVPHRGRAGPAGRLLLGGDDRALG